MENRGLYVRTRRRRALRATAALLLLLAQAASAAAEAVAEATVESVQWPAWYARDGRQTAIQPGAILRSGDRLITGRNARLLVRLPDGSAVKVGERADVGFSSLQGRDDTLQAAIEVGKGAFRFTTGLFSKVLGKREVRVSVPTLTIGIRGTDVWGKAADADDLVLLIEGRVSVTPAGGAEQELATPLEYLLAPRGRATERKSADPAQVGVWAKETEIDPTRPGGRSRGRHAAQVATADSEADALSMRATLLDAGYPVRLRPIADGRYAVRIEQIGSAKDAGVLAQEVRAVLGAKRPAP